MTDHDDCDPETGKVREVRRQWMVHEDGVVAHNMQEDEFAYKYGLNRYNRRTVREDIPVAKVAHTEEEERLQLERMDQLRQLQKREKEDSIVAQQIMNEAMLSEERSRVAREIKDQSMALQLQEQEKERFERKQQERVLAKERKKLERQLQEHATEVVGLPKATAGADNSLNAAIENLQLTEGQETTLRENGQFEDVGDFSDFYLQPAQSMGEGQQKELQEMQDEELARLLQDQEHKRGGQVNKDKLKALESQDGELARIIQEQEKLKAKARKQKHTQRHDKRASSQPLPPPAVLAGVAPHQQQQHRETQRQMSQPPPFRQPPDYHQRRSSSHHNGSGPIYMNQEDEVRQMRRARDSPPPLPPGHPVMEFYNPPGAATDTNTASPIHDYRNEPPIDYRSDDSHSPSNTQHHNTQHHNAFASIDPTFKNDSDAQPSRDQRQASRYEMGMLAAQNALEDDPVDGPCYPPGQNGPPAHPAASGQRRTSPGNPPLPVNPAENGYSDRKSKKDKKANCKQQ